MKQKLLYVLIALLCALGQPEKVMARALKAGEITITVINRDSEVHNGKIGDMPVYTALADIADGTQFKFINGGLNGSTFTNTSREAELLLSSTAIAAGEEVFINWDNGVVSLPENTKNNDATSAGTLSFNMNSFLSFNDNSGYTSVSGIFTDIPECTLTATVSSQTNVACNGGSNGTVDLLVTGGTAPYTYLWSNAATTEYLKNVPAGNYSVTVTDASGCTATTSVDVSEPATLLANINVDTNTSCSNDDGAATVTATGGNAPYNYVWSNGATTASITGTTSGDYTVTVTDANGCITTESVTIEGSESAPAITISDQSDASCNNGNDGSIDITVTGGTAPYTYLWSNGATTEDVTALTAGVYKVKVTGDDGCAVTKNITVGEPDVLSIVSPGAESGVLVYDEYFVQNQKYIPGTSNYDNWAGFRAGIDPNGYYTSLTISGSQLPDGLTLNDPVAATAIAQALSSGREEVSFTVDGLVWAVDFGCSALGSDNTNAVELIVNTAGGSTSGCSCSSNTYKVIRPGIGNVNWGGLGTGPTCGGVSQNIRVELVNGGLVNNITCNGDNNGSIEIMAIGGTAPYNYSWSTGETSATITDLEPGNYSVTITDANGCTMYQEYTVTEPDVLAVDTITPTAISCNGGDNGSINLSITGGTTPYTYAWDNGETTQNLTNLTAGTYNVKVTDANGCTVTGSAEVTQPLAISPNEVVTPVSCHDEKDGSITLNTTEGTAPYTYYWDGISEAFLATQGFEETGNWNFTLDPAEYNTEGDLIIDNALTNVWGVVEKLQNYFSFSPQEGTRFFCGENLNNSNGGGDFAHTLTFDAIDVSSQGELTLEFHYFSTSTGIAQYALAFDDTDAWGEPVALDAAFSWQKVSITVPAGATQVRLRLQSAQDSNYRYVGFDNVRLYEKGSTEPTLTELAAGTYTVTITDDAGCSITKNIEVKAPQMLQATGNVTGISCKGNDGAIDLTVEGGTAPYNFAWNTTATTEDLSDLASGSYNVTVTDANGCTATQSFTLDGSEPLVAGISATYVSCYGGNDGTLDLTVTGGKAPYTYVWNNTATTEDLTGLTAGNYSVTVTDGSGCTVTQSIEVKEPSELLLNTKVDANVGCNGDSTGSITMDLTGGSAPFEYTINGTTYSDVPDATLSLSGFPAGTYPITITDANGCTTTGSATITEPETLAASAAKTNVSCNGGSNGTVDLTVTGGTAPYTFNWSNTAVTEDLNGLMAGTYEVTVTDANGCTVTKSVDVLEPAVLNANAVPTNVSCNAGNDGTVDLTVTGGTAPYNFAWSNSATTEDMIGLTAGMYSVTVTDAKGCTATTSVTVTEPAAIKIDMEVTNVKCNGGAMGSVVITLFGGQQPFELTLYGTTYSNLPANMTLPIEGLPAGTYPIDVVDGNGCTAKANLIITEPAVLEAYAVATDVSCPGNSDGTIDLTVIGGTAPYAFVWNNSATTEDIIGLTEGTYNVTVTDANGCTTSASAIIVNGDDIAPTPDVLNLDPITAQCVVEESDLTVPTATDNCSGTVSVNHDATFPITVQGTTTITWTFADETGNSVTQTQDIVIKDTTAPQPDADALAEIAMECQVLESDVPVPTATDNCGGMVSVSHNANFPITDLGTTLITWTYTDIYGNASTQLQEITVIESPLANVTFDDRTVTYTGSVQTLEVTNLPTGASVTYTINADTEVPNGATDAGTYTATAIVTPPSAAVNCSAITLTATLTIDKAPQTITFDELAVVSLEDDEDFQLKGSASSGLPVTYSYTHNAETAPATVSASGFVTLQTSGTIEITVNQPGNANYLPAAPVTRTLQINSRDASAHSVTVEDAVFDIPSEEIYYLIDCGDDRNEVEVAFETETNAVVNPAKEFVIQTQSPGIYRQMVTITSQDGSTTQTYTVVVEKMFPFFDIVKQKFDNVLLVNNNPDNNGGYRFTAYTWYKNEEVIGQGQYHSAGPNSTDRLDPNASYRVEMTTENGEVLQTCLVSLEGINGLSASIFPNPNISGNMLQIDVTDYQVNAGSKLNIQMFSIHGSLVAAWNTDTKTTQIRLPQNLDAGVYVLSCEAGGQIRTFKLIIE